MASPASPTWADVARAARRHGAACGAEPVAWATASPLPPARARGIARLLEGCGFCPAFVRAYAARCDRCREAQVAPGVWVVVADVVADVDADADADADRFARCARDVVFALAPHLAAGRARRLVITYLPCAAPRALPRRPGAALGPRHVNGGVTWRALDGASADVLVFRREDAVKVLVHELLHAHRWGASLDDRAGDSAGRALASACGVRRGTVALEEACVEAAACEVAARWLGGEAAWRRARARAGEVARAAARHFAREHHQWRETTHAFAYIVGRWALMVAAGPRSAAEPPAAPTARTIAQAWARLRRSFAVPASGPGASLAMGL